MILKPQTLPKGWLRPDLTWHRVWHLRRIWQWKARAVAVCTLLGLIAVILGADKLWLLAGLIGVLLPIPLDKTHTLLEIERSQGEIYTTALVAPDDHYGFSKRLLESAKYIVRNAELPTLPWLEGLGIVLLASLAFVIPAQTKNLDLETLAVNQPKTETLENPATDTQSAAPVLNAPAAGAAPAAGQDAATGKAASGGTPGESGVGDTRPGGGNATDDPEAISRDYLDALERGAVNSQSGLHPNPKKGEKTVQDLNQSSTDQNAQGQAGSSGRNGQGGKNGQNGNQPGQPGSGQQNNGQQGQNGQGQQNGSSNGSNSNGSQGKQNQNSNGKNSPQNGGTNQNGADRFDRGDNGEGGSFPGQSPNSPQGRSESGKAGRGGGLGNRLNGVNAQKNGKLEYLPGELQGNQVRSGAMQLPGDPKRPLTLTPGTPAYQRAVENAVLDPRLPPEYQELLKNYYK